MSNSATSDTLLIKEIPISQNNVPNLSSHFSNFGKVKLVSTGYNGDPRAALVTFASPEEARKAFISPTPLFNDRMVQVHMHTANRFAQYSTANKQGWPCQHCSSVLASKQNLDKHIACKHAGVTCTVCNSRFETLNEYGKHFNAMHSEMSFNSQSGAKMQSQSQLQPPSQSTQNVFQSNETKPFPTEAIKRIRAKYNSLKKKLKKRDKANYKLVKFHTKSRNQLNATIKGQEDQLKDKTTALETLVTKTTDFAAKFSDMKKKLQTMEKDNQSLQLENGKLSQNLADERANVEMLKHTLTCVYKCLQR